MSPDKNGRKGQIITIDIGSKESYLIAYSFEEFINFIIEMFDSNKFFILLAEDDTLYFEFESGHFFNTLGDVYEVTEKDLKKIKLTDEYWKQYYNELLTNDNKISIGFLKKETSLFIIGEKLSLNPLMYMTNLKELILHDCIITDFSFVSKAKNLRKIYLVNCKFNKEELSSLSNLSKLSVLSLNCMEINSIGSLSVLKSLKELSLRKIDNFNTDEIALFKNLKNLSIDDLDIKNFDFLNYLKKLKELAIKNIKVNNLNYLKNLKNLKSFVLNEKAEDESDISLITGLKKIGEFQYPVSNMEFYKASKYLKTIGIDARNIYNIEMLKDTNINNVIIYNSLSEEEALEIVSKIQEYITLYSYKAVKI